MSLPVGPYKGPGSYPSIPTAYPAGLSEVVSRRVRLTSLTSVKGRSSGIPSAAASAEVGADGSGSIALSNLAAEAGLGYVNGQVPHDAGEAFNEQWTCMINPFLAQSR